MLHQTPRMEMLPCATFPDDHLVDQSGTLPDAVPQDIHVTRRGRRVAVRFQAQRGLR